jgi:hypothetical protein
LFRRPPAAAATATATTTTLPPVVPPAPVVHAPTQVSLLGDMGSGVQRMRFVKKGMELLSITQDNFLRLWQLLPQGAAPFPAAACPILLCACSPTAVGPLQASSRRTPINTVRISPRPSRAN